MSKFKVVVTDHVFPSLDLEKEKLEAIGAEVVECCNSSKDEIIKVSADADAILVCYAEITEEVINNLGKCKIIARSGIGVNNINIDVATKKGIKVTNVPDYCIDEVSDHALALTLAMARKITLLDNNVKSGKWSFQNASPMFRLKDKYIGLLGFGRIAREFATKVERLGLKVLVYDPYIDEKTIAEFGALSVTLDVLFRQSDFLSLHAPLTDETRNVVNQESLDKMKKNAVIINTSRGALIDEAALYEALHEKKIGGAALDVLVTEKADDLNPLLKLQNIIITPHVAFYSEEATDELRSKTIDEITRALTGQAARSLINKELI